MFLRWREVQVVLYLRLCPELKKSKHKHKEKMFEELKDQWVALYTLYIYAMLSEM